MKTFKQFVVESEIRFAYDTNHPKVTQYWQDEKGSKETHPHTVESQKDGHKHWFHLKSQHVIKPLKHKLRSQGYTVSSFGD